MTIPRDLKAAMFISCAVAGLELLLQDEPATHTRRARKISDCMDKLMDLLDHYPRGQDFDYVAFGERLFDAVERQLDAMLASGPAT